MNAYILSLADTHATLQIVGGKGRSLATMVQAGFPIPDGFHITTEAYRQFLEANNLQTAIMAVLSDVDGSSPAALDRASDSIRELFDKTCIPAELASAVTAAYSSLAQDQPKSVAVRSSATAEDLPEASFAGQQETYLNVRGEKALLEAVKKCWSSLWTARAIAYRLKNKINQDTVALAVVVQEMVAAEAAGILFTANPINSRRDEMVINAAWGLGEAIVGGLVSPDTIIADRATGKVKTMDVAEKSVITVITDSGTGEEELTGSRRTAPVLDKAAVAALVHLAGRIEACFGSPQDIEWCRAKGQFYIVQSRPITALPEPEIPVPTEWKLPPGSYAAMRNNIVELMADPLSPLFATLGLSAINASLHRFMDESFGMQGIMPPEIVLVVNQYAYNNGSLSARGLGRVLFGAGRILKRMFTGAVERWTESGRPHYYQTVASWQAQEWRSFSMVELVNSARQLTEAAIDAYGALISGVIPAAWISEALFTRVYKSLLKRKGDPDAATYLLGYDSLPIRADKSLFNMAEEAQKEPSLRECLELTPALQLATLYESGIVPPGVPAAVWQSWRTQFRQHLHEYGHMLYDLDFAHPLPADDPTPVLDTLKLYLRGQGANPHARQRQSAERRKQAVALMKKRLTGLRLRWFNRHLASAQKFAPLREDGLAEIGLAYPLIRQMLREVGSRFVQHNVLACRDDIFWLTREEVLEAAARLDAGEGTATLTAHIPRRKAQHQAALQVRPPMALPQMKVFGFDLMSLKDRRGRKNRGNLIKGVPASPGSASGTARVLHGPEDFSHMKPGDVLVAPITTPAWTPLFAMAAAIVTDVGGPLSHGSIVAREYGIPAVLGTGVATHRIHDGQTITVNGSAGTVTLTPL